MDHISAFAHIAEQAGRGELVFPTSVNAALKLQLALNDPDCPIELAIKLVLAEPVLAARTVALANSAAFQRGDAVSNARSAVLRIGYHTLQSMVAAMVVRQFGNKLVDPVLRDKAEQLWEHSAHVAVLARVIARHVTGVNPDTALFAGIVHEVGGFYLLSRAEQYPGLLDDVQQPWNATGADMISQAVMHKLSIPAPVLAATEMLRTGMLAMPPDSLADTLMLAKHFAPVVSPLARPPAEPRENGDSMIDFIIDQTALRELLAESADDLASMSAALLV